MRQCFHRMARAALAGRGGLHEKRPSMAERAPAPWWTREEQGAQVPGARTPLLLEAFRMRFIVEQTAWLPRAGKGYQPLDQRNSSRIVALVSPWVITTHITVEIAELAAATSQLPKEPVITWELRRAHG